MNDLSQQPKRARICNAGLGPMSPFYQIYHRQMCKILFHLMHQLNCFVGTKRRRKRFYTIGTIVEEEADRTHQKPIWESRIPCLKQKHHFQGKNGRLFFPSKLWGESWMKVERNITDLKSSISSPTGRRFKLPSKQKTWTLLPVLPASNTTA